MFPKIKHTNIFRFARTRNRAYARNPIQPYRHWAYLISGTAIIVLAGGVVGITLFVSVKNDNNASPTHEVTVEEIDRASLARVLATMERRNERFSALISSESTIPPVAPAPVETMEREPSPEQDEIVELAR